MNAIRIYGGYIKAGTPQSCAMLPIVIHADSKDAAKEMAKTEAFKQFPVDQGWSTHHWDVLEIVISPTGQIIFDSAAQAIHKAERPNKDDLDQWPDELFT